MIPKLILMTVICFVPNHGELREAWRFEKRVTIEHCLTMNQLFSGGGKAGAITTRCGVPGETPIK